MKAVTLRLGDERYSQLTEEAQAARRSLAAHILWLLDEALSLKVTIEALPAWEVDGPGKGEASSAIPMRRPPTQMPREGVCTCGPGEKARGK